MATTTAAPTKRKRIKAVKAAPKRMSNARLLKLVAKNRPPQSWFEETDVPFHPTKD